MAMVRTEIRLPETADLILQVHDEVDIDVEEVDVPAVLQILREEFCQPIPLAGDVLRFPPENAVGVNWGELEEVKN